MRAQPTARTGLAHPRWQSHVSEVMKPLSLLSLVFENTPAIDFRARDIVWIIRAGIKGWGPGISLATLDMTYSYFHRPGVKKEN